MTALQIVQKFYPKVTSVKDATRAINVEVIHQDTNSKAVKNHKACAFAEACKRSKPIDGAVIAVRTAYLIKGRQATRYLIPESLSREIVAFDRNGRFASGEYYLAKPVDLLGAIRPRGPQKNPNGKKVRYRHATQQIRSVYA